MATRIQSIRDATIIRSRALTRDRHEHADRSTVREDHNRRGMQFHSEASGRKDAPQIINIGTVQDDAGWRRVSASVRGLLEVGNTEFVFGSGREVTFQNLAAR